MRLVCGFGMILVSCAIALADDHPPVQVEIDPCIDASPEEIRRVISVELGALLSDGSEPSGNRTRAIASCDGAAVTLRVDDPITGKSMSRAIDLGDAIPRARARLVALAIVELISASWTELDINLPPRVQPAGPRSSPDAGSGALASVRKQTDLRMPGFRISVLGGGQKFFSRTGLLAGGGLRLARDHAGAFGWTVDAQAHRGSESTSLGHIHTDVLSVGAAAVVHHSWSRASVHLGGGMRGGPVRLSGVPDPMMPVRGSRFWAPWIGALAVGSAELLVTHRFTLDATIEGGYVILPVAGLVDDRRAVAVNGAWLKIQVGVGMFL